MRLSDKTIELQEKSLKIAKAKKEAGRDTALAVQRFQAEVRKNQSEKLIVKQEIIEAENQSTSSSIASRSLSNACRRDSSI